MNNKELTNLYNEVYLKDINKNFYSNRNTEELLTIASYHNYENCSILDIGCGEGDLVSLLNSFGATYICGVDFSKKAISIAKNRYNLTNCNFICGNYQDVKEKFDVVTMLGVLEHMDNPLNTLKYIQDNLLKDKNSLIITSSPSFLNPRGYIWITLQLLLNVQMSLSDIHFLTPNDFEEYAVTLNSTLKYKACNQLEGVGKKLILDFEKRLRSALKDKNIDENIDKFLIWLEQTEKYCQFSNFSGVNIVYKIQKINNDN